MARSRGRCACGPGPRSRSEIARARPVGRGCGRPAASVSCSVRSRRASRSPRTGSRVGGQLQPLAMRQDLDADASSAIAALCNHRISARRSSRVHPQGLGRTWPERLRDQQPRCAALALGLDRGRRRSGGDPRRREREAPTRGEPPARGPAPGNLRESFPNRAAPPEAPRPASPSAQPRAVTRRSSDLAARRSAPSG